MLHSLVERLPRLEKAAFLCLLLFLVSDRVSLKAPDTSSFTKNLSVLIVQIAVSGGGGSGNESESVVTEYAVGRRGRAVGKSPGSEVSFASGIR